MDRQARDDLMRTLKARFEKHTPRHPKTDWKSVEIKLEASPEKIHALYEMERTGGEPDIVDLAEDAREFVFCDCSPETPEGRRGLCYDREAFDSRKANKPSGSAMETASAMGIEMLTEEQYRELQKKGEFDRKTSSWVRTPDAIRKLGGALFCDRRYNHVFVYHNGADSYYSARGFRGLVRV